MADPSIVSTQDKTQRNSPVSNSLESESTVLIATAARVCYWNGTRYEEGSSVSADGNIYDCSLGHWVRRPPSS